MVNLDIIQQSLEESFEDFKLDQIEKSLLLTTFQSLNADQRAYARNQAFKIVRESPADAPRLNTLKWLERVIKTIDLSRPATNYNKAYFSPGEDCRQAILDQMKRCKSLLDICVFTISDNRIRDEIVNCYRRGVNVRIISDDDKSNDQGSDIEFLAEFGVSVAIDRTRHHMHHKFAIFDNTILMTGSFNWTRSATEFNHENILETNDGNMIAQYTDEYERLWKEFSGVS